MVLAGVVSLACLTTAIGGISAFGDYINELNPKISYRRVVLIATGACLVVANIGLAQLIALSIPILMAIYPVAIGLVLLTLVSDRLKNPRLTYRVTLSVALVFGLLDGLSAAGVNITVLHSIPLFDQGLAWVLPTFFAFIITAGRPVKPSVGAAIAIES